MNLYQGERQYGGTVELDKVDLTTKLLSQKDDPLRKKKEQELKMAYEREVNMGDTVFRVNMRMGDFMNYNTQLANNKFNPVAYNDYLTNEAQKVRRKKMWGGGGSSSRTKNTSLSNSP